LILETENVVKVDQSSLTGESLPITKGEGDQLFSGSIVKMGEVYALVIATGPDTYFGKAAGLIQEGDGESHVYKILAYIGYFCIALISVFVLAELLTEFIGRRRTCKSTSTCEPLENSLVLIIGGVPIAMPTVLSVTMALGARELSKKNAIVARLTAVEELAGMDVLCSDKTGTLTKNKLTLADPVSYLAGEVRLTLSATLSDLPLQETESVLFDAGLASSRETEDAIDVAILDNLPEAQKTELAGWERLKFVPFDPVSKKTTAQMRRKSDDTQRWARKGAPQVILDEAENRDDIADQVEKDIDSFASRGYRSLGVSVSDDGDTWTMVGLIPMFDPPRDDTKETIGKIQSLGIQIRMITGDQVAIAKETARLIGLGDNIVNAKMKGSQSFTESSVMQSDGFAQVFPEHKFAIVKSLLDGKHCVGMTGDGVNDAPALKKASIGIAVEGATDAARAAADIVLVSPGLSVIYHAVVGARKIFQRMKNYAMYSITSTVRIVLTFGILTLAFGWYFPVIAIAFLAILNDLSMISISRDRVRPSPTPDKWDMLEIFGTAIVLGTWLAASTIVLWIITIYTSFWTHFGLRQLNGFNIRGLMYVSHTEAGWRRELTPPCRYLQVSISNLATIFVTRSQGFSWMERPGVWVAAAFLFSQAVSTFFGAYGLHGFPHNGVFNWDGTLESPNATLDQLTVFLPQGLGGDTCGWLGYGPSCGVRMGKNKQHIDLCHLRHFGSSSDGLPQVRSATSCAIPSQDEEGTDP
jgi:H+-transporting ATPase